MRKAAIVVLFVLAIPFVFASCKPAAEEAAEEAGVSRLVTTDFPSKIALTPYVVGSRAPEVSVILSREALISYVSVYEKCYDFVDESVTSTFYDVVTGYNEEYFKANALVVCVVDTDRPANRYTSEGIGRSGDGYDWRIRVSAPPSAVREDTSWHLFLEVPDSSPFLRDSAVIRVRYVESKGY